MKHALAVLEWDRIVGQLAQQCETPRAGDLALELLPETQIDSMRARVEETSEAWDLYQTQLPSLRGVYDVGDHVVAADKGRVLPGELLAQIGKSVRVMAEARRFFAGKEAPRINRLSEGLANQPALGALLERSLDLDGHVRDEASPELAAARAKRAKSAQRALERIQAYATGKTRELLSDPIYTERNGRYVVPLKAENRGKIKGIVHDSSSSGQTIYVEPEDVVALGNAVREAEAAERAETERVLRDLSASVGLHATEISEGIDAAAALDLVFAKVRLGSQTGGCVPEVRNGPVVSIKDGRHPLIDRKSAVPLSVNLGDGATAILITGPNTGGKTVAIKTVGLTALMAQSGMMPPAEAVSAGCFTQFWADIGDEQSLQQSLSTFSAHIKNIAEALAQVRPGALVLLDEVGAGTDPDEGAALAVALLKEFSSRGAVILASTHYGELKLFASSWPGFMNASMEFDVKSLRPTYRFLPGMPGSSHAFRIAERYGIPQKLIEEATSGFSAKEQDVARLIEDLEGAQRQARASQSEADRLAAQVRRVEAEAKSKLAQAEESRRSFAERATAELNEFLRSLRVESAAVLDSLKNAPDAATVSEAKERLKEIQKSGSERLAKMSPAPKAVPSVGNVVVGAKVRVNATGMTGKVARVDGDKVEVIVGMMSTTLKKGEFTVIGMPGKPAPAKKSSTTTMRFEAAASASGELHLRMLRAEEAQYELERYLDRAIMAGLESVRIVHGKGEGILRDMARQVLKRHTGVKSCRDADPEEGGHGVTIAQLK